jgi:hypothetical protein
MWLYAGYARLRSAPAAAHRGARFGAKPQLSAPQLKAPALGFKRTVFGAEEHKAPVLAAVVLHCPQAAGRGAE